MNERGVWRNQTALVDRSQNDDDVDQVYIQIFNSEMPDIHDKPAEFETIHRVGFIAVKRSESKCEGRYAQSHRIKPQRDVEYM